MAALYLQNAVFTPEPSEISRSSFPHSRNISTISGTTLHASPSEISHPAEPLLHPTSPDSIAYIDLFSRQPTLVDESGPLDWGTNPTLFGDPPTLQEKKRYWEKTLRKRLKRLRFLMRALELIFGGWAIYNTTRYFIAFTKYNSTEGQLVSLILGISTAISFAFIAAAGILSFFKLHLLMHAVSPRLLTFTITSSLCLSSLTLIAPAIVNMVMLFIWRNRLDPELSTENRCHIDIDVIWSASNETCPKPYGWGTWMALSATRLGLTAIFIAFYYAFLVAYDRTRKPTKHLHSTRTRQHRRSNSIQPAPPRQTTQASSQSLATLNLEPQTSRSTMVSRSPSKKLSLQHSRSAGSTTTSSEFNIPPHAPPVDLSSDLDHDSTGIVERFRSIVAQITREADQAVSLARSDHSSDSSSGSQPSSIDAPYDFYPPPIPPSVGYNEFGQPYPPEESVPMLNGFIRRMPTIESMGSREIASTNRGSSMYSGSIADRLAGTNSRPPTRLSLYPQGSEPPSRTNSLAKRTAPDTTGGSTLAAMFASEVGELVVRVSGEKRGSPPSPSPLARAPNQYLTQPQPDGAEGTGSQSSRASTIPTSYYTATMGSVSSVPSSMAESVRHDPNV